MELFRNENNSLKAMIADWQMDPKFELEATFGADGQVDQTRFLAVAQRLKTKGYVEREPKDYMTITIKDSKSDVNVRRDTLKNNTRFTIEGSANVKYYCEQESLDNIHHTVILKTASGDPNRDNLPLDDYEMKFKVRREEARATNESIVNLIRGDWANQDKAFRLIRRWTFEGDGCVFDLSMIRSNKRSESGAYIFSKTFNDPNQKILSQPPTYEIEVELLHDSATTGDKEKDVENAKAKLIKAVGEVLRGIQRSAVLIRKNLKKQTLDAYITLVGENKFRGVKPRTLEMKNFIKRRLTNVPNIRDGYNVTDKADGLRVLGFCNSAGELFLIDKAMNVYRTGLLNENCRNSLVDGEWITRIKDEDNPGVQKTTQQLWLFDIYMMSNKEVVDSYPFYSPVENTPTRYKKLQEWYGLWIKDGPSATIKGIQAGNRLVVNLKNFAFAGKDDEDIFKKAALVLSRKTEYNTDGLIFTSNASPLPGADMNFREQFKWKPAEDNTIDFLVRFEKDSEGVADKVQTEVKSDTNKTVNYKTLILKVGSTMDPACANPRDTILFERPFPKGGCKTDRMFKDKSGKYRAVAFNPSDYADPLASICKVEVQKDLDTGLEYITTELSNEPIQDGSIIEMRYDMKQPDGWRWIPVRVRTDKTEKFLRGELSGTLNADFTAESVWASIHNPITKGMIMTGSEAPTSEDRGDDKEEESVIDLSKPYFERKANRKQLESVEGLRNFHKHLIKGETLLKPALKGGNKDLLDMAVGEAADINRWVANNVGFVYGIDIAAKGILDSNRGAYSKYLNRLSENAALPESQQLAIAPMIFGIGDVSKNLATGEAGMNEDERNILRSVFGKFKPDGAVPPFVQHQETEGKGPLTNGVDVIACMFALHYVFKSEKIFDSFMANVKQNLRVGGYFVACFFDGQKVFDLLEKKTEGQSVTGTDRNTVLWRITKQYNNSSLPTDATGFGLTIKNQFISIGSEHTEYLVPFELLEAKMKDAGCLLVTPNDLKAIGLPSSSETFDVTYNRNQKKNSQQFPMDMKAVQQYSFLNRWCIFKRYSEGATTDEDLAKLATLRQETMEEEVKPPSQMGPKTLAWQDVPRSDQAGPTPAVKQFPNDEGSVAQTVARAKSSTNKPIESLATAMAQVRGVTVLPGVPKEYDRDKVFYFGAGEQSTAEIKDEDGKVIYEDATRYLAPYYPFVIVDEENPNDKVVYPSIYHYLAAMEYKYTNKPSLGKTTFSRDGTLHQDFIRDKKLIDTRYEQKEEAAKKAKKGVEYRKEEDPQYKKDIQDLLVKEADAIAKASPPYLKSKQNLEYNAPKWLEQRMDFLKTAYEIRYAKDAKFREILSKLRDAEKYLLYRPTKTLQPNTLGAVTKPGRRNTTTRIGSVKVEGENILGHLLMKIAKFPGFDVKIESMEDGEDV